VSEKIDHAYYSNQTKVHVRRSVGDAGVDRVADPPGNAPNGFVVIAVGLVLSITFWSSGRGFGRATAGAGTTTVVTQSIRPTHLT